jgi:hypothetical protein
LTDYSRLQPMPGGGGLLCWRNAGTNWKQEVLHKALARARDEL